MSKPFASVADTREQTSTLHEIAPGVHAYTAQGDPNVSLIIGDDGCMVVDARATPASAQDFIADIRAVTDKPVTHVVLSHYHAVRTLGASAFKAGWIASHEATRRLILERGQQDWDSEFGRMPRLFKQPESIPGLTHPNVTFTDRMWLKLGRREVELMFVGRAHTEGDALVWLPDERVLIAGDTVECQAALYMGDAYFADWLVTLERIRALGAVALVPGRGAAAVGAAAVNDAIDHTREFVATLLASVRDSVARECTLRQAFDAAHALMQPRFGAWPIFEHCMPFNVSRCYDEVCGARPRIWTAARDRDMWAALQG